MEYLVVIEKAKDGRYSAYVPDLPGGVTCGESIEETRGLIAEAIRIHLESLQSHGEPVPSPSALACLVSA